MEGWALLHAGAAADALASFRKAHELAEIADFVTTKPPYEDILPGLAIATQQLTGDTAGAQNYYRELIARNPK